MGKPPKRTLGAQLSIRLSSGDRAIIDRAVAKLARHLPLGLRARVGAFVRDAAVSEARRILGEFGDDGAPASSSALDR